MSGVIFSYKQSHPTMVIQTWQLRRGFNSRKFC